MRFGHWAFRDSKLISTRIRCLFSSFNANFVEMIIVLTEQYVYKSDTELQLATLLHAQVGFYGKYIAIIYGHWAIVRSFIIIPVH